MKVREPLRVVHVSAYDTVGGAARAARALHEAMLDAGIDSMMLLGRKDAPDATTHTPHPRKFVVAGELDRLLWRTTRSPRPTWRSPALFGAVSAKTVRGLGADIINLHWVTNGLLTIRQIGKLPSPAVWSMYDMWPFSGTEHYHAEPNRYEHAYAKATRPRDESGFDLDRWTWQRKRRHWRTPIAMVPASQWLETAVQSSSLMAHWPVRRIPHLIDTERHRPTDRWLARDYFGLPRDRPLIAFLATAGIRDERKGWIYLREAVERARSAGSDVEVIVIGPKTDDPQPFPVHWLGPMQTEHALSLAYAAADVVATPSVQDTMPLSAMEAQSSGRPVVGFAVGGLPDIVEHEVSGYLAPAFDTTALSLGLMRALGQSDALGAAARLRAEELWSPGAVVAAYVDLYGELLDKPRS